MTERIDLYLVQQNLTESRSKAQALIQEGRVLLNGIPCRKASEKINVESDTITIAAPTKKEYVSRGGKKLAHALAEFNIDFTGQIVLDIGASTGGFTDCALQHGAAHVYALDVGTKQLHHSLQNDSRVTSIEQTHAHSLTPQHINGQTPDAIVCDVSFISLTKILPIIATFLPPHGIAICLVKPQFEVGPQEVNKTGIVRKPTAHLKAIQQVIDAAKEQNLFPRKIAHSPLGGKQKNIEYLLLLEQTPTPFNLNLEEFVAQSFQRLNYKS